MKLICTAREFAGLIRMCAAIREKEGCSGCVLCAECDEFLLEAAIDVEIAEEKHG